MKKFSIQKNNKSSILKNSRIKKKNYLKNWYDPYSNFSEYGIFNESFLSFVKDLIVLGAFSGSKLNHSSQEHLFLGYRNFIPFYDLQKSLELFVKCVRFLGKVRRNKKTRVVILGNPPFVEDEIQSSLRRRNLCFFSNNNWPPGFLSKNSKSQRTQNSILIVYKPGENSNAVNEALYCNIPVLGFASPSCDIGNLDYPVVLNLEKAGLWYLYFLTSLLK